MNLPQKCLFHNGMFELGASSVAMIWLLLIIRMYISISLCWFIVFRLTGVDHRKARPVSGLGVIPIFYV